jgi:hypothetical protein
MATLSDAVNGGTANDRMLLDNTLITEMGDYKTLLCYPDSTNNKGTFRDTRSLLSSGYLPASGKKFVLLAVRFSMDGAAPSGMTYIGQSDNDVGLSAATALTNHVRTINTGAGEITANSTVHKSGYCDFATDKYISAQASLSSGTLYIELIGKEVTI